MSYIEGILFWVSGGIELLSIVSCVDWFCILSKGQLKKGRIIPSLITYTVITILGQILINTFGNIIGPLSILMYYLRIILAACILYGCINQKIIYITAFLDLAITLIETSTSCILANLIGVNSNDVSQFVMTVIQIAVLIIILIAKKKSSTQRNMSALSMIPRRVFVMLILAIIFLSALSSLISFPTDNRMIKENALIAIVIMLTAILICIVISLFLNVIAKQHFTAVSQMMEKQVELQISHYDNLEKMDSEMRKFRHDYTNHLRSILSLIQMHECSQAEEYIEKLQKTKYKFHTPMFYTGNRLADAILSEKSAALDEDSRIEYSGIIPSSIENADLCIILSNSLDNAIEACRALQTQYVISIFAGNQQGYFVLSVKNPTVCSGNFCEIPPTTKPDKTQHGMGLYNIENAVKKYDGQMKVKCENGFFELMITMKI